MLASFQDGLDFLILLCGTCLVNALLDIPLGMASMVLADRISRGIEWACTIMETKVSGQVGSNLLKSARAQVQANPASAEDLQERKAGSLVAERQKIALADCVLGWLRGKWEVGQRGPPLEWGQRFQLRQR